MIQWEDLDLAKKQAIKALSEASFEKMLRIWFQIGQAQKFQSNWHFTYLCWKVEQIIKGEAQNVIFNITPGSGKTEIFSIHMPVYGMLKSPKVRNLNLSFSDSLVKDNGIRTREIIGCDEFQELWPTKMAKASGGDITALNDKEKAWLTLTSRAIGGQVTGKRGGYMEDPSKPWSFTGMLTLDDPDKPKDMYSAVKRKAAHTLLKNTVRSRRMTDRTPCVVVQQRLHVNDSTWFLMNGGMGGMQFEQVIIPALVTDEYRDTLPDWLKDEFDRDVLSSEPVEIDGVKHYSFWPAKESAKSLLALREADLYTFESQYQQKPIALGGNAFKSEWFQYYGDGEKANMPKPDRFEYLFTTADTAQKAEEIHDYSVFVLWGKYKDRVYFIDGIRGKWEAPELEKMALSFYGNCFKWAKENKVSLRKVYIEDKASGTGLIQSINKKLPIDITPVQRDTDKVTRAMDAAPIMKAGRIVFPESHPMLTDMEAELIGFTFDDSHPHDDIVDNVVDAGNFEMNLLDDPVARMKRLAGMRK
nr:MAG: terminase large subunit [Caudoviricetes sp.]UYL17108.1 MAG: terminase large subunit [Caudoviricetes sp.]